MSGGKTMNDSLAWFCFVLFFTFLSSRFYALGMHSFSLYCPFPAEYLFKCKNHEEQRDGDKF